MRHRAWVVVGMMAMCGCAGAYESRRPAPVGPRPVVQTPVATQPGCQEPEHQPFPSSGSYVPVDEIAEAVTKMAPDYPHPARESRAQGTVLLRALVCEHGRVVRTEVVQSIPLLDEAAAQALMQWTFQPARSGGRPVAVWVDTPLRFTLN